MGRGADLRVLIISAGSGRGLEGAGDLADRSSLALVLGPLSKLYLLRPELLLEIVVRRNALVVPSSLDDPAVYVRLRKAGARICRGAEDLEGLSLACLERGEAPWKSLARASGAGALTLILSQDLDLSRLDDLAGARPGHNVIHVSYGISQPLGIRLGRWISAGIPPFSDSILEISGRERELEISLRPAEGPAAIIRIGRISG